MGSLFNASLLTSGSLAGIFHISWLLLHLSDLCLHHHVAFSQCTCLPLCACLSPLHVVVQLLSCVRLFEIPWTAARQASLSFTLSWRLFKLVSINLVKPSNHFILCHPLSSRLQFCPASGFFFKWVGPSHLVAKVLELQNQFFQWIFRIDCLYD